MMEMSDVKDLVYRFLSWRLPDDFSPDGGIEFKPLQHPSSDLWPIGTNLLNFEQTEIMIRHVLEDVISYTKDDETISGCIDRNRKDISKLLGMLAKEKLKTEQLEQQLKTARQQAISECGSHIMQGLLSKQVNAFEFEEYANNLEGK